MYDYIFSRVVIHCGIWEKNDPFIKAGGMTRCWDGCEKGKEREPRKLVHGMDTMNSDAGNRCQKQTEVHRFKIR